MTCKHPCRGLHRFFDLLPPSPFSKHRLHPPLLPLFVHKLPDLLCGFSLLMSLRGPLAPAIQVVSPIVFDLSGRFSDGSGRFRPLFAAPTCASLGLSPATSTRGRAQRAPRPASISPSAPSCWAQNTLRDGSAYDSAVSPSTPMSTRLSGYAPSNKPPAVLNPRLIRRFYSPSTSRKLHSCAVLPGDSIFLRLL